MYAERLAVVSPAQAKRRGVRRMGRRDKRTLPKPVRLGRREDALLDRDFFVDLFLNFLWRLDEFLRNGYRRGRVGTSNDRDVDAFIAQSERIVAGRSVQIHAGERGERISIGPELNPFAEPVARTGERLRFEEYRSPVKNGPRIPSYQRVPKRSRCPMLRVLRFILWRPYRAADLSHD